MALYSVTVNGRSFECSIEERTHSSITFTVHGERHHVTVAPKLSTAATTAPAASITHHSGTTEITAPMSGFIVHLQVEEGSSVTAGDTLLVLEAMKMQNPITAPCTGKVTKLLITQGDEVKAHQVLLHVRA